MKAAMYSGLLSSDLLPLPNPPFSCPSGNCTWDPFATLSISTVCSDLTPSVQLNCSSDLINRTTCNFASPNDQLLAQTLKGTNFRTFMITDAFLTRDALVALEPYVNITGALSVIQWVRVLDLIDYPDTVDAVIMPNSRYDAGRCLLYLSVKQIAAQVSNGVYTETVLQDFTRVSNTSRVSYTVNGTNFYFRDPWDWDEDVVFNPPFAPQINFTVAWQDFDILASSSFQSSIIVGNVTSGPEGGFDGPPMLLTLLQAEDVAKSMQNMVHYMTTSLRSNDTQLLRDRLQNSTVIAPSEHVRGTVLVQTQFVTVRWVWITLPGVTLVLAIVFLAQVIVMTSNNPVGMWKSSPLALFFHTGLAQGLDAVTLIPGNALTTVDELQKAGEHITVQVAEGDVR